MKRPPTCTLILELLVDVKFRDFFLELRPTQFTSADGVIDIAESDGSGSDNVQLVLNCSV